MHMNDQLSLDESSDVPIYQQIVNRIEQAILRGTLKEGEFLPSVREFAIKHHINPNTISKAYQLLQGLGLAEAVRGLGLKVASIDHKINDKRKKEILAASIEQLIETASSLRISNDKLLTEIRARMNSRKTGDSL